MSIKLTELYDNVSEKDAELIADLLGQTARKDTLPASAKKRIYSRVLGKAGITMKERTTSIKKKIAVTAAILAAAAVTVTAGAKLHDIALTRKSILR